MERGLFIETGLSPKELARGIMVDDQRFIFQRKMYWESLGWFGEMYYLRCDRCGDELMGRSPVDEEINHALGGCNGCLREWIPPQPERAEPTEGRRK